MIVNRQRRVRVPITLLERFLSTVERRLRLPADAVAIALVSDAQIARWNRSYRGKNRPTDVLSFPADGPGEPRSLQRKSRRKPRAANRVRARQAAPSPRLYLGDIAIAPAVARRNARVLGRTFDHEMRILILHGVLHLMGYDHETDRGQMDRRENRLRRELGLA
jgi:probable rRNA maturation factor